MASINHATSCDSSYVDDHGMIKVTFMHCRSFKRHPKSHISMEASSLESAQHIVSNEDLLTEILLHLPPKSLLRFQTVSKQWLSIISSQQFRRFHTRRNAKSFASTIGLFLCRNPCFNFLSHVVCIWLSVAKNQLSFSVYSSGNRVWRHSTEYYDSNKYEEVDLCCYYGVFSNGAVHWVSQTGPFLAFDVSNCKFRSMPSTPIPEQQWHRNIEYFGESGGHLHLINRNLHQTTEFDILELEAYYSGWFVKYHVNLDFLPNLYPAMVNQEMDPPEEYAFTNVFIIICFLDYAKDKARQLVLSIPGKIVLCNLQDGMIKELADVKPAAFRIFIDGARYDGFEMYRHVETLACV